ncbi:MULTISPECIES: hypothetical protein [unclassified Shinella]|uniref:hypothetical protein n=1 Tax=unclassified Shinella TaxID=2643062 RepID=UPI0003C54E5A|nr:MULTISPECIES: hypothetical protein [unclassified Shinella]EYR79524.1 hypothetical protein SHLA_81c000150 [Shinella sp. DD12]MCW5712772.1 hypothetical protein [Shinella sp.]
MSDMSVFLNAMKQHADSMDNLRLYLMQISQLMEKMAVQTQNLGAVVGSMSERITKLEAEGGARH